jgi:DNA-binding GntR family transcriptional regulator
LSTIYNDAKVEYAGNSRLTESCRPLTKTLLLFRLRELQDGGGFAVSNAEHAAVVDALVGRDGAAAGRLLRRHAAMSRARMHKAAGAK